MKKRFSICFLLCFFIIFSVFADFGYKLDLLSLDPIYSEYLANRGRAGLSISYLSFSEGFPDKIIQDTFFNKDNTVQKVVVFPFDADIEPKNRMVNLQTGETFGLVRNTFTFDSWLSPISFDFSMQGVLSFFFRGSFDDNIGYDGMYFYGLTCKIGDFISFRFGNHHYCSHYGDAILKQVQNNTFGQNGNNFWLTYKYVRMQTRLFSISIEPCSWLRIYGEVDYPPRGIYSIRPDMFAPNWIMRDGLYINPEYPDSYNARIVATGIELTFSLFKNLGKTAIGYDLRFYEEGKVKYDHENGGEITFDEDAPWEMEHNIKIAQGLSRTVSVEIAYHNGRSPFNNNFDQHTQYIAIGLRFNPDDTVTLFDI
ncbi:MAG: hypothetical protein WC162_01460 [Sphaerochaetaceae bacterium]|nr:hypothetical protein [Sphaerochaetaceae bacterium]